MITDINRDEKIGQLLMEHICRVGSNSDSTLGDVLEEVDYGAFLADVVETCLSPKDKIDLIKMILNTLG